MLKKIKIENLALVENVELEFERGLTVLTGETGAGKSVIVTALSLVLGERADREYIRFRADKGVVEAVFDISGMNAEYKNDIAEFGEDTELSVYREIAKSGSSKIKINSQNVSLARLKEVMTPVAEILGQHANQMLMDEDNHLEFLDHFASLDELKQTVAEGYTLWKKTTDELHKVRDKREIMVKEKELLLFQQKEITQADITVGEEEKLIAEKKILDSARALMASSSMLKDIIDDEQNSLLTLVAMAEKELERMVQVDTKLEKQMEDLTDIKYRLSDMSSFIEQYGSSIEDNPNRIEEINVRLDEIYNLKKKYGGSEEAILISLKGINERLAESPPDIDEYIRRLESECDKLFKEYSRAALALSDTRKKAGDYLQKLVVKELKELAIDGGDFKIEFIYEDDPAGVIIDGRAVKPGPNGLEEGRIMFSANPGEPLKSLVKTASGGEISRVLLALKSAEKKNNQLKHGLLVFDEVDAGIGGRTANEVAGKLKKLAGDNQVVVITHLHQIARLADNHYMAEKGGEKNKRTVINVKKLDSAGIQKELARMIALPEE